VTQLEVTSGVIQLDNQSATSLAQSNLPGITSPQVYFTQDGVGINGTWGATLFGTDVGSDLAAFGNLTLQDGQLEFALEQASLAGIDIMDDPQSTQVNDIVGSWVNSLLGERPIESFSLDNGSLDINLLN
jgi:hypothetical protein